MTRQIKPKPWHRIVDDLVAERPMTAFQVHSALQDYYFTSTYNSRTGLTTRPRGRAWFPRMNEVAGYLRHSKDFYQPSHGQPWRMNSTGSQPVFEAEEGTMYNDEGFEIRPIGWRPGTGYRDEASPEDVIYRTYEEAVEWIRQQERDTHQRELDRLVSPPKLMVNDIEYSGTIFEHPRYNSQTGTTPPEFGHESYIFHPGFRWNRETRVYDEVTTPPLPNELFIMLNMDNDAEDFVNYNALINQGINAKLLMPYGEEFVDYNRFKELYLRLHALPRMPDEPWVARDDVELEVIIEELRQKIENAISDTITLQTSGIPSFFTWSQVDNYLFNEFNPQISRDLSHLYPEDENNYNDGKWLSQINEQTYKSSDAWDCTEEMNVDTGEEYFERMGYSGCAGNNATYFTYSGGGNYPYYVEAVILD
jgi:hypothetical protein